MNLEGGRGVAGFLSGRFSRRQGIESGMDGKVLLHRDKHHCGVIEDCVCVPHQSLCVYYI